MTVLNRDVLGRRVQVLMSIRAFSDAYTLLEWWEQAVKRRARGYWPRCGPWPIFRYWMLGPLEVRVFTEEAMRR